LRQQLSKLSAVVICMTAVSISCAPVQAGASRVTSFDLYYSLCKGLPPMTEADARLQMLGYNDGVNAIPSMLVAVPSRVFTSSAKDAFLKLKYFAPGTELQNLFDDPEFDRAIERCFPKDETSKFYFKSAFIKQDAAGKLLAGVGTVFVFRGVNVLLARLSTFGATGLFASRVIGAVMTAQIGLSIFESYLDYQAKLHPTRELDKTTKKMLAMAINEEDADISELKGAIAADPKNPQLKELLSKSFAMKHRLQAHLK
jgi:hypothetical protein